MRLRILATVLLLLAIGLTGCHEEDFPYFHWVSPETVVELPTVTPEPPEPTVGPEVFPEEEVGEVDPEPTLEPPSLDIKGNISSTGEKIYHVPGGAYYDQVKIDEAAGEMWFRTEEEAQAAGWRKALR